jgi:hypothetical protein
MNPFDFIKSINTTKIDMMKNTNDDDAVEAEYVPFITNRSLSYFPETILIANLMNIYSMLDNKLQYHFLLNSVRPAKRFAKWVKREDAEDVELVKQFYGYNNEKARQALSVLTPDNLHYIKQKLERGGNNDQSRNVGGGEANG